ncbi:hypothetical protein [Methylocapsa sp. S129]|uniref:hypothetical protein n=1 Tax=Methylocapsa sp. S129 TaxID=1641869 RepID=UPI00131EA8DE|nr:hypothetical protein [Methylocapsa sp. S129]
MKFLAIGKRLVPQEQLAPLMAKEPAATLKLYVDGILEQFWYVDKKGPVFLLNAESEEAARAALSTLPFTAANLVAYDVLPLIPLVPLGQLIPAA